ncbi:MAG TPA: response regulator [Candidatus Limnocylindrales bacterium]|nr:response regulator [Candidatus Limnocylindrales bacterium]
MKSPLHILHLENDPNDAALVQSTLAAGGIACATTCVQNRDDFVAALEHGGIDLILADCSLPVFDGMSALKIAHAKWPTIPLIFVSGTLGEERAIDSLQSGATDYVLKERLGRLVPAVRRAMQEVEERAERQRAEQMVQNERDFSEISLNSLPGIFYLFDQAGKFLRWNKNFERVSGYTTEELARMRPLDFFVGDERDYITKKIEEVFAEVAVNAEAHFMSKDGTRTLYYFTGQKIQMEGRPCLIGTGIDISERKKLEMRFIEVQKMEVIGQLASGLAHDFNNILVVIMGYSDLMMQELGPDDPLRKHAGEIRHASVRAAGLTRQLLVFSRRQTVQPVVLDLNDVVKDLDKMLRRLVDEHIEMTIVPGKQTGRIKADSGYVGQVLMNLVVNARDAMPNGGKLTIATNNVTLDENYARTHRGAIPGDYVMISVSDTGTGMTDEVKAHLFEAFFTTKPKGKGTGLGLATCQTIVQQSGGHIGVYSEAGKGTTFKIYFPRVDQPLEVAARPLQTGPLPRGTETLLVVEDEPSVRHLAAGILEAQGYTVLRAVNGQDALRMVHEHKGSPIRLVVTDVIMPLMGGKVMAEWLKTTCPGLKILFTSGYTDDAIAHHGVLEPGVAFLPKPYTPATLAHKVRAMLDNETDTAHLRKQTVTINQSQ